jgi:hypothetical protein
MFRTRLCPEVLEDRAAPTNFATTVAIIAVGPAKYMHTAQVENVTVQAMYTNGPLQIPVPAGTTINVTDGGQTLAVQAGPNGQACATFSFGLFLAQEQPQAHTVSAQVPLQTFPYTSDTLLPSATSAAQAPDTTLRFYVQLFVDFYLFANGYSFY